MAPPAAPVRAAGAPFRGCLRSPRLRSGEGFFDAREAPNAVDAGGIGEDWQRRDDGKGPADRPEGLLGQPLIGRRAFLAGGALLAFGGGLARAVASGPPPRVVSMDYALGETLIAIGAPFVGQSEAVEWGTWVVEPALPAGVRDVGSALLPNFELIARLKPDLILTTPFLDAVAAPLARVGPSLRVSIYEEGNRPFDRAIAATRLLAKRLDRSAEAETFIAAAQAEFDALAARARRLSPRPVILVNMMDGRHVRIHGGEGLFQSVLTRIGIANAYTGAAGFWGFETMGVERLAPMGEARLFSIEPVQPDAAAVLARSTLWNELPFVREGRVSSLPAVNAFGALPSALRLARLLVSELERVA